MQRDTIYLCNHLLHMARYMLGTRAEVASTTRLTECSIYRGNDRPPRLCYLTSSKELS